MTELDNKILSLQNAGVWDMPIEQSVQQLWHGSAAKLCMRR